VYKSKKKTAGHGEETISEKRVASSPCEVGGMIGESYQKNGNFTCLWKKTFKSPLGKELPKGRQGQTTRRGETRHTLATDIEKDTKTKRLHGNLNARAGGAKSDGLLVSSG